MKGGEGGRGERGEEREGRAKGVFSLLDLIFFIAQVARDLVSKPRPAINPWHCAITITYMLRTDCN